MCTSLIWTKSRIKFIFLSVLFYLLWLLTINFSLVPDGYIITILLPFVFIIGFFGLLWSPLLNNKTPFITVFCLTEFLRLVVLSVSTINSYSNGKSVFFGKIFTSDQDLFYSGLLLIYEFLITSTFIYISSLQKKKKLESIQYDVKYNENIYLMIFLFSLFTILVIPETRNGLTLLVNKESDFFATEPNVIILLLRELFVVSKYFLLFFVIKKIYKYIHKFNNNLTVSQRNTLYIILVLTCIIVIGIRIGINRKRIIADAIACYIMLKTIFPYYKRITMNFFGIIAAFFVISTSIFRGATESFLTFGSDIFSTESLQAYLCGQYNIVTALTVSEIFYNEIGFDTLLYSTFRSCFGIGTILSYFDIHTLAYYYNQVASFGYNYDRESQILPMIGEGLIYFTPLFAPTFSLIFVYLGLKVDEVYKRSHKLEYVFLSIILGVYLGQALTLTSNILVNNISFKIALYLPLVIITRCFFSKRRLH